MPGDGSPEEGGPEDSGVYRAVVREAVTSVARLSRGLHEGFASNIAWIGRVTAMLKARATRAVAGSEQREAVELCQTLCDKEVRAGLRPTMMPPLTLRQLAR